MLGPRNLTATQGNSVLSISGEVFVDEFSGVCLPMDHANFLEAFMFNHLQNDVSCCRKYAYPLVISYPFYI